MSCIYFQILWTLDTGSARSSLLSTGKRFISVYHGLFQLNICKLFIGTIFNYMDTYYFCCGSYILLQVDITSTGCYYDDVDINQWNSYSRLVTYKSFPQDNFFVRCRHRPYICIYYGTRYAPIHITNYASSVCITIFLRITCMTHVCHVVYCNMLLCIVCYCMYVTFEGIHVVIVTVFHYIPP